MGFTKDGYFPLKDPTYRPRCHGAYHGVKWQRLRSVGWVKSAESFCMETPTFTDDCLRETRHGCSMSMLIITAEGCGKSGSSSSPE